MPSARPSSPAADLAALDALIGAPRSIGEARVWRVDLDAGADALAAATSLLAAPERARVEEVRRPESRRRRTVARGALRIVLARALRTGPHDVAIEPGEHGKPHVAAPPAELRFSVAHSGDLALIALHPRCAVGVDLERIAESGRRRGLARRIAAQSEAAELDREVDARGERALYERWVAKEAILKAAGVGLSLPMDAIVLRREADGRLGVVALGPGLRAVGRCLALTALELEDAHVAALALWSSEEAGAPGAPGPS